MILQLFWLRDLWVNSKNNSVAPPAIHETETDALTGGDRSTNAKNNDMMSEAQGTQLSYVPVYVLGNLCLGASSLVPLRSIYLLMLAELIAGWMFFWVSSSFAASSALVALNTLAQLIFVARILPPMNSTKTSRLTHFLAKTMAGIGLLDLWHNGGVVAVSPIPYVAVYCLVLICVGWIIEV